MTVLPPLVLSFDLRMRALCLHFEQSLSARLIHRMKYSYKTLFQGQLSGQAGNKLRP